MEIKVILADDHAVVREGLKALLEADTSINVIGLAENGRDAVRQVQELCPDVVVMDISMPELNGIEATRQILEFCPVSKVIILSMYSSKEYIARAIEAGVLGYLLKETAGKEVVKAVHSVNSGKRYFSKQVTDLVLDSFTHKIKDDFLQNPLYLLSAREREVLQLVAEGKTSVEIADIVYLSPKTVETYRSRLMKKLEIGDIAGLVKFAIKHGLITLDS